MSVLRGPRTRGSDLVNSLIIEVVSMPALRQVCTDDQYHAEQHEGSEASDTDPAHKGNETLVDGNSRREVRTVTENKMPIIRGQGVDLRRRARIGGP